MAGLTKEADGFPVHGFAKGRAVDLGSTTLANGGFAVADLETAGFNTLTVLYRIGNATTPATAATDAVAVATFYEDDGTTLFPAGVAANIIPDVTVRAASLSGSTAFIAWRFYLRGIDRVRVGISNLNASPLQGATVIYYLAR